MNYKEKEYDCVCPECGTPNRSLYLQETDGLYECEGCGAIIQTVYHGSRCVSVSVTLKDKRSIQSVG